MPTGIKHPYITTTKDIGNGKPIIKGTRTRIANIVAYYKLGFSPEELRREFPHLSLSEIYDALSYYHENSDPIDKDIDDEKEDYLIHKIKE